MFLLSIGDSRMVKHDDVINWKHFLHFWSFVRGIHRSPMNSLHKGQWRGALMFSLTCAWIKGWVNNREAGDLRRHRTHDDVIVMRDLKFNLNAADVGCRRYAADCQSIAPKLDKSQRTKHEIFYDVFLFHNRYFIEQYASTAALVDVITSWQRHID